MEHSVPAEAVKILPYNNTIFILETSKPLYVLAPCSCYPAMLLHNNASSSTMFLSPTTSTSVTLFSLKCLCSTSSRNQHYLIPASDTKPALQQIFFLLSEDTISLTPSFNLGTRKKHTTPKTWFPPHAPALIFSSHTINSLFHSQLSLVRKRKRL